MRKIIFHDERCVGCSLCSLACSREKTGLFASRSGFIHVSGQPEELKYTLDACFKCDKQSCISACPKRALRFGEKWIELDESLCVKCKLCVKKCVYQIAVFRNGLPYMCDLCGACTQACPWGALELIEE